MKRRERKSLVKAVLIALILVGAAVYLLARPSREPVPTPDHHSEQTQEPTVFVELVAATEPILIESKKLRPADSEPMETPSAESVAPDVPAVELGGLSSNIQVDGTAPTPESIDPQEQAPPHQKSVVVNQPPQTTDVVSQPQSAETAATIATTAEASSGEAPSKPLAILEDEPAVVQPLQRPATALGKIPVLHNVGDTAALYAAYPRLEVVWVLESKPLPDETLPRVLFEVVPGKSGQVLWKNLSTSSAARGFEYATEYYVTSERVRAATPPALKLWPLRDEIARLAGMPSAQHQRFEWGYYRHRAEVFHLNKVRNAFVLAQSQGRIDFDPARGDLIEIEWRSGSDRSPVVAAARFIASGKTAVELEIK